MDTAVHAALLTSVEVVATGAAATAEGAMMMGMAMGAGAAAVAGGRPQHLPPSVQPPACWQFPIFLRGLVFGVEAFQVAHASPGAGAVATLCLCHCSSHNWLALESVEPLLLDSHPA